jgi:hypothetical protein
MVILIILGVKFIKSEICAFKLAKPLQVFNLCLAPLDCLHHLGHSTSAEAGSNPVSQEIPCVVWTMKVHRMYTRTCHQVLF